MNNGPSLGEFTEHIDDKRREWCDAKRDEIVRIAEAEVGDHKKGSPQVDGYWRDVAPFLSESQVKRTSKKAEWCGAFALWCLHRAGVALDVSWAFGYGFIGPAKLKRTKEPRPGDVAYTDAPYQHHAVFVSCEDGQLVTIDGNQPDVRRKSRPLPKGIVFYSVEPLVVAALDSEEK